MRVLLALFLGVLLVVESNAQTEDLFVLGHSTRDGDTTGHYYPMLNWSTTQYKELTYYKRDISSQSIEEFMNFRLIYPVGYDSLDTSTEYPMIVMLHGAGESGRVWAGRFIYDPSDPRYDNNENQLKHGGAQHQTAVNKNPSDPRAFNGFVLFPQSSYSASWQAGWNNGDLTDDNRMVVHIMDRLINTLQIDQNKIYSHGLSGGAVGVWDIASKRPDLFAGILPMSGVGINEEAQTDTLATMPLWLFQGGKDYNPSPSYAEYWIDLLESKGGKPRYTLYPNIGHGTWNTAYAEPDFFSWMLEQDKRNIFVFGEETNLCPGAQIELGFSKNYLTYQWYKDGDTIPGAVSDRYFATEAGSYTVRFTRQNGSIDLSFPLEITQDPSTYVPPITVDGTVVLGTPYGDAVNLIGPEGYAEYNLYKDSIWQSASASNSFEIVPHWDISGTEANYVGSYTITVSQVPGACESYFSEPVVIFQGNGPSPPAAPTFDSVTPISATEIELVWTDNSNNEDYFEIWRESKAPPDPYQAFAFHDTIPANSTTYLDNNLIPSKKYNYIVRAVNSDGGNNTSEIEVITLADLIAPSAPTNLLATAVGEDNIDITWEPAIDNIAVDHYDIYVDDNVIGSSTGLSYSITGLSPLTSYSINIRAVDANANTSIFADGLWVTTTDTDPALSFTTYYSKSSGALNDLSTWGDIPDGTGSMPTNFTSSLQLFVISNGHNTALTTDWTVSGAFSKVIVENSQALTLQAALTGIVEIEDNASLNLEHATAPSIGNCSASSTVNINMNAVIPRGNFGNIIVSSGAQVSLSAGTTFIQGNLTINDASTLIKGQGGSLSTINIGGDINFNTSLSALQSSEYYNLRFTGGSPHVMNLPSEDIYFASISADFGSSISFGISTPTSLNLGTNEGGGLLLETTSEIALGDANLNIINSGSINPGIETGVVSIDGGDISYTSSSTRSSNLSLSSVDYLANDLVVDISSNASLILYNNIDIANRLKVIDGTIDVNNSLTLLSNNTKTAFIDIVEQGGVILGEMKMQRHIRQGRYWRYFSSPFSDATIADWQQTMAITGNFTGSTVIEGVANPSPSMYYYDESVGLGDNGWVVYPPENTDSTAMVLPGKGYALFVRADTADLVFDMPGIPNQGDFTFDLTPDPTPASGSVPNDGWSLIGNPYASAIQWDTVATSWTSNGINDVIYLKDNENYGGSSTGWLSYDRDTGLGDLPGGEIAPGQAFYVRAISATPSLTISESAKSSGQPSFYRETSPANYVSIYLRSEDKYDVSYVIMLEGSSDVFENAHDGIKRESTAFSVSTLSSDSVDLSINKLSSRFCSKDLVVNILNTLPGNYQLEFNDFESFDIPMSIKLYDSFNNTELDLSNSNTYSFEVTEDPSSFGSDRFILELTVEEVSEPALIEGESSCDMGGIPLIYLEGASDHVNYQVYDNEIPISEPIYGQLNGLTLIELDTSLIEEGSHVFTLKAWNNFCDNVVDLGDITLDYYHLSIEITEVSETLVSSSETDIQWLLNGEIIDGATEQIFTPKESGEYSLLLTKGDCSILSETVTFVVTDIDKTLSSEMLSLYPNPSSGLINIELGSNEYNGQALINIYTLNGSLVKSRKVSQKSNVIDVNDLEKGLYLVYVSINSNIWKSKFIKE